MSESTHRMPTISASEALQHAASGDDRAIRLVLRGLDALLSDIEQDDVTKSPEVGGVVNGEVTELVGPPGAGKTALCVQVTAAALAKGDRVIWIDTATKLCGPRLADVLGPDAVDNKLSRLCHFTAPTLPHLIALLFHPPPGFIREGTRLIVIDSLSALVDNAYPRGSDDRANGRNENSRWLAGRRQAQITDIGNRLSKLAAVHDIAILVANVTVTHIRVDSEAALRPALTGQGWESAITRQIYIYRDWLTHGTQRNGRSALEPARLALNTGNSSNACTESTVAFRITATGIEELDVDMSSATSVSADAVGIQLSRKRKQDDLVDSDEDGSSQEYGWDEEDQLAAEGLVDASFL